MLQQLPQILPLAFGLSAAIYLGLAVALARRSEETANSSISYFLLLIGTFIAGAAFSYQATDLTLFSIGRVLTLSAAGKNKEECLQAVVDTLVSDTADGL